MLNNPARRLVQEFYEAPLRLRMAGRLDGKRALEIGCGQGFGMEIILRQFGAAKVSGIDLDPKMIARAQERILPYTARADVPLGNVTTIQAADESFDAVFDFGVIHHVPAWENAIREVRRVLKPAVFSFSRKSQNKRSIDGSTEHCSSILRKLVSQQKTSSPHWRATKSQ